MHREELIVGIRLEEIAAACRPDSESFVNPGKSLALALGDRLPMTWGTTDIAGVAAYRMLCQLAENAKLPGIAGVLPEANHNQVVAFDGPQRAGTIVVDTPGKFLYLVQPGHQAIRYGIGVGRPGFAWSGLKTISQKREWPDWTPPEEMIRRRPDLPRHMAGGPGNPLGARALYLGSSLYRIHGTNEPHTIGQNVSSGCIRMTNEDVTDLYDRVRVGARVIVI